MLYIILLNGSCKVIFHIPIFQKLLQAVELVLGVRAGTECSSLWLQSLCLDTPQHCHPCDSSLTTTKKGWFLWFESGSVSMQQRFSTRAGN